MRSGTPMQRLREEQRRAPNVRGVDPIQARLPVETPPAEPDEPPADEPPA